ncbi:MAG: Stp1/IreP family PP2C-type Ser/Thr phosphatase [Elusimicrobiota bacterium]
MLLEFSAKTDKGLKRPQNEDAYGVFPQYDLFVACDGMGGHAAGDYASRTVVETVGRIYQPLSRELFEQLKDNYENIPESGKYLIIHTALANRFLFRLAVMYPPLRGMGTTLTSAMFDKGFANIVNVGDSRTYLFRNSDLSCVTVDHSWVEELLQDGEIKEKELENFREKNVITRALGTNSSVKIDYKAVETKKDDIFLLCSDGLCGEVSDEEIEKVISLGENKPDKISSDLIKAAKNAGGSDNITVVVIKVKESEAVSPQIKEGKIFSFKQSKEELELLDECIDEHLSPAKASVPASAANSKKKIYSSPFFITLAAVFILFGALALFTKTRYKNDFPVVEAPGPSLSDILIRTNPSGARVTVQSDEKNYNKQKTSPADFMSMESGSYTLTVEKEGYEKKTAHIYLREGTQENVNIKLNPLQQLFLNIGVSPGFDTSEKVYINGEPYMYYGRPLTVGRIGLTGKRISMPASSNYTIRIASEVKEIAAERHDDVINIKVENSKISIDD